MYTYIHTYTHTKNATCLDQKWHDWKNTDHVCVCIYAHIYMRTPSHTNIHTRVCTYVHDICMHSTHTTQRVLTKNDIIENYRTCGCMYVCMYLCTHTYTLCIHVCTHTYTRTYTHTHQATYLDKKRHDWKNVDQTFQDIPRFVDPLIQRVAMSYKIDRQLNCLPIICF